MNKIINPMNKDSKVWGEKYRPYNLEGNILTKRTRDYIQKQIDSGSLQNMVFAGHSGIGKSSLAQSIANELVGYPMRTWNASESRGIDLVRSEIIPFADSQAFDAVGHNIIILEEADELTQIAEKSLKVEIERFSDNTRFILVCNDVHLIDENLLSRFEVINFTPSSDDFRELYPQMVKRLSTILTLEGIQFTQEDLQRVILGEQPDVRKMVSTLQRHSINGKLDLTNYSTQDNIINEIVDITINVKEGAYNRMAQWVESNTDISPSQIIYLYERQLRILLSERPPQERVVISAIIATLAEYDYRLQFVVNKIITLKAMFDTIMKMNLGKKCNILKGA